MPTSVLLYNLYPKNRWKELTRKLLSNVPHDDIYVNVTLDRTDRIFRKKRITSFLSQYRKIRNVFFTDNNRKLGEVPGFETLRKNVDYSEYHIVTYIHSKGASKPKKPFVGDWVELMRYFVVERHDLCIQAFNKGYALYGTRLGKYKGGTRIKTYRFCDFWYAGTFVSVNLDMLRKEFLETNVPDDYYGVEAFWGNLCKVELAYSAHDTPYSLHDHPYPPELYRKDLK